VGGESGQASSDYIAILLVCACVLGAGGGVAAAAGGSGMAGAVSAQFARAICRVTGGDCERDRIPCVTSIRARVDDLSGVVAIIRLSGGRTLLRERRSDGMELITLAERGGLGIEVGAGAEAGVGGGAIGDSLAGSISGRVTRGRAWLRPAGAQAQALVDRIGSPPAPDFTWGEKGMESRAEGRYHLAGLSLDAEDAFGARRDTRTGERTFTIRRRNELAGDLARLGTGAEAGGRHVERYAVTVDRSGRPVDLVVTDTVRYHGGVALPGPLKAVAMALGAPALRRGRIVETETHLDLTDADNLETARAFIEAVRSSKLRLGAAVAVSEALSRRLESHGVRQRRVYLLDVRHTGARGRVGAGVSIGLRGERSEESARLVEAAVRGLDGNWRRRDDCLPAGVEKAG
jgi:hypothetical protein